jgi:hypothetical protein
VSGRGIDLNDAMVEVCRGKGLDASNADALSYLGGLPDQSLGGLFAAQVVEHLEPAYLTRLLETAFEKLRPGAPIVLETINPACWFAFFESYIRDITHVRPLHPDTLKFLLIASGFNQIDIRYRAPYPEHEKLQPIGPRRDRGRRDRNAERKREQTESAVVHVSRLRSSRSSTVTGKPFISGSSVLPTCPAWRGARRRRRPS